MKIVYLGIFLCWAYYEIETAEIYIDKNIIRSYSDYVLTFIYTVPTAGKVSLEFPDVYLEEIFGFECFLSDQACTCEYSSRVLNVSNCFSSGSLVQIKIKNFYNPLYAGEFEFKLYVYDSFHTLSAYTKNSLTFEFLPQTLECILQVGSEIAAEFTSWNLTIAPKYSLSSLNQVILLLPSTNCLQSLTCTGILNNCGCSNDKITINLLESAEGVLSLLINSIQNPLTTAEVAGIYIKISANEGDIEISEEISIKVSQGSQVYTKLSISDSTVYANSSYYFEFNCDNIVPKGSDIFLEFNLGVNLFDSTTIDGIFGLSSFLNYKLSKSNASIYECFNSELNPGEKIALQVDPIQNPKNTKPVEGYVKIKLLGDIVCEGYFEIEATIGSLEVEVRASNNSINQNSEYFFSVYTDHFWENVCIFITFPTDFYIFTESCDNCLNSSTVFFSNVSGIYTELIVKQVLNPGYTYPTSTFLIQTFDDCDSGNLIEQNNSIFLTMKPGYCDPVIELLSYTTGDYTSYKFSITINNTLPTLSDISIQLPSEIQVSNLKSTLKNTENLSSTYKLILTENSITITKVNTSPFQGTITFTIQSIKNPSSLKPSTIICYTINKSYYIDYNIIELTMKNPHNFKYTNLEMTSNIVGELNDYYLEIFPFNLNYDSLELEFEYNIGNVNCSVSCVYDKVVRLNFDLGEDFIDFSINSIKNPPSTAPVNLIIRTYENGFLSDSTVYVYSASIPAGLEIYADQSNSLISLLDTKQLNITPSNLIPFPGVIQLWPSNPSVTCPDFQYSCTISSESIIFKLNSNLSEAFTLNLNNFTNSVISGQQEYKICSLNEGYQIDCGNFTLNFTCDSICEACENTPENCTSCYNSFFLYNNTCSPYCLKYFYKSEDLCKPCQKPCSTCSDLNTCESCLSEFPYYWVNYCYATCPLGSYPDSNFNCTACAVSCSECSSKSSCSSCKSNFFLYNNSCLKACPSNFFPNNSICLPCSSNCAQCENFETCEKCESNFLLYNNICQDKCPEGITVEIEGFCRDCISPCQTCTNLPSYCTSCVKNNLYDGNCVEKCPDGTYSYLNTCLECDDNCLSCSKNSFYCESCNSSLVLYKSNCLVQCPLGFVNISGKCGCFEGCRNCDSEGCISCTNGYFLYNRTCVLMCPVSTFNRLSACIDCASDCLECIDLDHCLNCSLDLVLFNDNCLSNCPNGTYLSNANCFNCLAPCIECIDSALKCTLCESPLLLFNYSCVSTCPEGYSEYFSKCVGDSEYCSDNCTFAMSKNSVCDWACYVKACNFDGNQCPPTNYSDTLAIKEVPVPISITGGVGVTVAGISSIVSGSSFIAVASPVSSLLETVAGLGLMATVSMVDGTKGRSTMDTTDSTIMTIFFLLFIINTLHVLGNIAFVFIFYKWIVPNDSTIRSWYTKHTCAARSILCLCSLISYKFFKISSSKIFNLKSCSLNQLHHKTLWTALIYLDIFTILTIELPLLGICLYIFLIFSKGSYLYIVAVDSSIIISFIILITFWELIRLKKDLKMELKEPQAPKTEIIEVDQKSYIEDLRAKSTLNSQRNLNYYWKEENNATDIITE